MKSRMGRRGKGIANILMIFNIVVMGAVAGLLANHHSNEQKKEKLEEEIEQRRTEFEATAKQIIESMKGKERGAIKSKMTEAGIPDTIIKELLPAETAEGAAPAEGGEAKAEGSPAEEKKEENK